MSNTEINTNCNRCGLLISSRPYLIKQPVVLYHSFPATKESKEHGIRVPNKDSTMKVIMPPRNWLPEHGELHCATYSVTWESKRLCKRGNEEEQLLRCRASEVLLLFGLKEVFKWHETTRCITGINTWATHAMYDGDDGGRACKLVLAIIAHKRRVIGKAVTHAYAKPGEDFDLRLGTHAM